MTATTITNGRSNLTVLLDDGRTRWVLRTPPRVGRTPSAHDVTREYRLIEALQGTAVPVATPVLVCEDGQALGAPFAVTRFVDGTVLRTRTDIESLTPRTVVGVTTALVSTLASLHAIDPVDVGLGDFARPISFAERQHARWSRQWDLVGPPGLHPLADDLRTRLASVLPRQRSTGIVHGDFRIDNTIMRLDSHVEVAAVVDWELWTVGDPVADVAMMCAYRDPAFDLVIGEPTAWASPALPSAEVLAAEYTRAGGVALTDWTRHLALACFKIAVIAAGIEHRRRLTTRDPAPGSASEAIEPFLLRAASHLKEAS